MRLAEARKSGAAPARKAESELSVGEMRRGRYPDMQSASRFPIKFADFSEVGCGREP